jgi:hypothetical protein
VRSATELVRAFAPRSGEKVAEGRMRGDCKGPHPAFGHPLPQAGEGAEAPSRRRLAIGTLLVTLAILLPTTAHACPVCFGNPDSPMMKGTSNAIWFLLGIVGVVQAGFIALFWSFWRRARALKKFKEQFHVVH